MAVKVMWARAVREEKTSAPQARVAAEPVAPSRLAPVSPPASKPEKPRRRRSSVFDADGNEVFITLACLKCHKMRPLSQFGLRKMADGAIRNQPWCKTCRAESAAKTPRKLGEAAEAGESSVLGDPSPSPTAPTKLDGAAQAASPNLAAQIAAALHAGRR
ncbi:MAG TPA: hypothetical protein VFK85_08855 [Anaeromyxobacteraceae bacterium]|nr:hypothetical protein [Anaeromyxobacteraceae bacterium]